MPDETPGAVSATDGGNGSRRRRVRRGDLVPTLVALFAVVGAFCAAMALGLNSTIPGGMRIGFGLAAVPFAVLIVRYLPIGVYIEPDGVLIRNVWSSRRLAWHEIDRFELGSWAIVGNYRGAARLTDGELVTIAALNPPRHGREVALPLIDELNGHLGAATGRTLAPATLEEDAPSEAAAP
jgi:hypothetical protein